MSIKKEYKGLCSTCTHAATCTYLMNQKEIVWQCEEYTDKPAVQSNPHGEKTPLKTTSETGTDSRSTVNEDEFIEYKGLCVNCENRKVCKKEIVEGGIWHCENYE